MPKTINRRPRSRATLAALQHLRRYKTPSKEQVMAVADQHLVHWTTLYRALRESA